MIGFPVRKNFLPYLWLWTGTISFLLPIELLRIGQSLVFPFQYLYWRLSSGYSINLQIILTRLDPIIDDIFIESSEMIYSNGGKPDLKGIFSDGDSVKIQVLGQFSDCHEGVQRQFLRGKKFTYEYCRTITDWDYTWILFKTIKIEQRSSTWWLTRV